MTLPLQKVTDSVVLAENKSPLDEEKNPFKAKTIPLTTPEEVDATREPGTPWWWLDRLVQRLMDRQTRFDTLERYALGDHPLPNLDKRYVRALEDLQKKATTNYCDLVIKATIQRMKVRGFRFGKSAGEGDPGTRNNPQRNGNSQKPDGSRPEQGTSGASGGKAGGGRYDDSQRAGQNQQRGNGSDRSQNQQDQETERDANRDRYDSYQEQRDKNRQQQKGQSQGDSQRRDSQESQRDRSSGKSGQGDSARDKGRAPNDNGSQEYGSGKPGQYPRSVHPADIAPPPVATINAADSEARDIWDASDMDLQSPMNLMMAATFGVCYGLVGEPGEDDEHPYISIEDPRCCITERDPLRYGRSIAGLKLFQDSVLEVVVAVLYLPEYTYVFTGPGWVDRSPQEVAKLTREWASNPRAGGFKLISIEPNSIGEVCLVEGQWQPSFGPVSMAEHENVLDIQDRINHTVLDRLIITKNQAYRQRWVSGVTPARGKKGGKGARAPAWDPGADMLWVTDNHEAKFGDFEQADITQVLEAVKNDVGDMAAITQTPGTYLMNRMVNVSGDTLSQDQIALVMKVGDRCDAMGWFYEKLIKLAFAHKGDKEKANSTEAQTLWADPERRKLQEQADAASKFVDVIGLQLTMERLGFSPDEIEFAVQEQERRMQQEMMQQQALADQQAEQGMNQIGAKGATDLAKGDAKNATDIETTKISAEAQKAKAKASAGQAKKPAAKK